MSCLWAEQVRRGKHAWGIAQDMYILYSGAMEVKALLLVTDVDTAVVLCSQVKGITVGKLEGGFLPELCRCDSGSQPRPLWSP